MSDETERKHKVRRTPNVLVVEDHMLANASSLVIKRLLSKGVAVKPSVAIRGYMSAAELCPWVFSPNGDHVGLVAEDASAYVTLISNIKALEDVERTASASTIGNVEQYIELVGNSLSATLSALLNAFAVTKSESDYSFAVPAFTTALVDKLNPTLSTSHTDTIKWDLADPRFRDMIRGGMFALSPSGGGKTTLLRKMAGESTPLVRWSEPIEAFETTGESQTVIRTHTIQQAIALTGLFAYIGESAILDSIRLLYSAVGGGGVVQGLNADFAYAVTTMSNFFASMGHGRMLISVNPVYSTGGERGDVLMDTVKQAILGSVSGIMVLDEGQVVFSSARLTNSTRFFSTGSAEIDKSELGLREVKDTTTDFDGKFADMVKGKRMEQEFDSLLSSDQLIEDDLIDPPHTITYSDSMFNDFLPDDLKS